MSLTDQKIVLIEFEGNDRMARFMTNLVLYRFGLQPTSIKHEGENKERYLRALCASALRVGLLVSSL